MWMRGGFGFTILEMLVAILLVLALALLTVQGVRRLTNESKAVINLNQLRQIAMGLIAYAGDHGNRLPYNSIKDEDGNYTMFYTRQLALGGYVIDSRIFFSPWGEAWWAAPEGRLRALNNPALNSSLPWSSPAYGANSEGAMPNYPSTTGAKNPVHLGQLASGGHSARLMVLRDVYNPNTADRGGGMIRFGGGGSNTYLPQPGHRNGYAWIHAAFADGHVEIFDHDQVARFELANTQEPYLNRVYTR